MSSLRPEVAAWIERIRPGSRVQPLAGDASTRRFFRLVSPGRATEVVMDYGAPFEGTTDDVVLAGLFEEAALPCARVLEVAPVAGCLLLEDLGDLSLEAALAAEPARGEPLYRAAVDLAVAIAARGTPVLARSVRAAGPALDAARFRFEMDFFAQHYAGSLCRRPVSPSLRRALHDLADAAAATPVRVLCHRDFHSRNLMVRADGTLALVDLQDARWGPDTYDLASLLRDAYVDLDEDRVEAMVARYLLALPSPPEEPAFRDRFHVVSAQRMLKALGTFGYQSAVLGRRSYLDGVPRTVERLRRLLPAHPGTAVLAGLLEASAVLSPP
jgi:N-acetylmuramate 1-kinase